MHRVGVLAIWRWLVRVTEVLLNRLVLFTLPTCCFGRLFTSFLPLMRDVLWRREKLLLAIHLKAGFRLILDIAGSLGMLNSAPLELLFIEHHRKTLVFTVLQKCKGCSKSLT